MRERVAIDQVLIAAKAVRTTFGEVPRDPVHVHRESALSADEAFQIAHRYSRHGFVVVQLGSELAAPDALAALGASLSLGEAFTPPLYTSGKYIGGAVSRISAAPTGDATAHPSFEGNGGLELHCDGTLQDIGYVKVSMLLCESPGAEGGETTLFNASAAYAELAARDTRAAAALATPGVLTRQANINGSTDVNIGPAFSSEDGELVSGYSVTLTDRWRVPLDVEEADVQRGVEFLRCASRPGSRYFLQLALRARQVIVLDNTRVSHGRTPYRDSAQQQRCLYRSLHLRHPCVRAAQSVETVATPEGGGE